MPNRIIKESTFTSDRISQLTDFEFRLWVGLLTYVDDAGRGDARPAIIKGRIFALRDRVTLKEVDEAVHGLAAKGCVSLYTVGGRPYLWFPTWGKHQRVRDVKPKYPSPEDADIAGTSAALGSDLPQSAAYCGLNPNPNPNPNPKREARAGARIPTVDDVRAYCMERGNHVDPERFVDFYTAKGWRVGNQPMRDWKACVRTWERREAERSAEGSAGGNVFMQMLREENGHG